MGNGYSHSELVHNIIDRADQSRLKEWQNYFYKICFPHVTMNLNVFEKVILDDAVPIWFVRVIYDYLRGTDEYISFEHLFAFVSFAELNAGKYIKYVFRELEKVQADLKNTEYAITDILNKRNDTLQDMFENSTQSCKYVQKYVGQATVGYPHLATITEFSIEEIIQLERTFWSFRSDHLIATIDKNILHKMMDDWIGEELTSAIFNAMDINHDGEIDFQEFVLTCNDVCRGFGHTSSDFTNQLIAHNKKEDETMEQYIEQFLLPTKDLLLGEEDLHNSFRWFNAHIKNVFSLYFRVPQNSSTAHAQTLRYWLKWDSIIGLKKGRPRCAIDIKYLNVLDNDNRQAKKRKSVILAFGDKMKMSIEKGRLSLIPKKESIVDAEFINNQNLVDTSLFEMIRAYARDEHYIPIKRNLRLDRDYAYIPEQVAKYLMSIFGIGPYIPRDVIEDASGTLYVETHKVVFKIYADVSDPNVALLLRDDKSKTDTVRYSRSSISTMNRISVLSDKKHALVMVKVLSHHQTVGDLINRLNNRLNCSESRYRLWEMRGDRPLYIISDHQENKIHQLNMSTVSSVLLEAQNPDGSWPRDSVDLMDDAEDSKMAGLANLGNTCYMNSVLQCLIHTEQLTNHLKKISERLQIEKKMSNLDIQVIPEYCRLVEKMTSGISIDVFPTFLKDLLAERNAFLADHEQHDALEFLSVILDTFDSELKKIQARDNTEMLIDLPPAENGMVHNLRTQNGPLMPDKIEPNRQTIVHELFEGKLRSTFACKKCRAEHFSHENFTALTLPVITKHRMTARFIVIHHEGNDRIKPYELSIQDYCNLSSLMTSVQRHLNLTGVMFYRKIDWFFKPIKNPDLMVSSLLRKGPLYGFEMPEYDEVKKHRSILAYNRVLLPKNVGLPNCCEQIAKIVGWPILIDIRPGMKRKELYEQATSRISYYVSREKLERELSKSEFNFKLNVVHLNTIRCARCKWNKFCMGHEIGEDPTLRDNELLIIDWDPWVWYKCWNSKNNKISLNENRKRTSIAPIEPTVSLKDCLGSFLKWETLDEMISCEHCGSRQYTEKKYDICELPPVLVVHLNRFEHLLGTFTRSNQSINFDLENFVMNRYDEEADKYIEERYDLYGLACHYGSFSSGHYIAYTKSSEDYWTMYNDDVHKVVPASAVNSLREPCYIFFYQKSKGTSSGFTTKRLFSSVKSMDIDKKREINRCIVM